MLERLSVDKGSLTSNAGGVLAEVAWHLAPPLAFMLGMLRFFPHWNAIWIVNDEGYNLMKALLVERGYVLYTEIWSDQAPLLTYLLAGLFRLNGTGYLVSRYFILLFSCVLLWAVVQYLRMVWGNLHGLVGAVLLVLLPNFLVASAAVLVGQPSLTFAMLSMLALAAWHLRRRQAYLALSAAAMSLSLLTKLFTGFLAPVFLIGLLASEYARAGEKKDWPQVVRPALLWGLVLSALTLGLGLLMVDPAEAAQLVLPHLSAATASEYPENEQLFTIHLYLLPAWPVLLAALIGTVSAWRQKRWLALYPLAWTLSAYLFLLINNPVWWHHQYLVTYPAVILAAGFIGDSLSSLIEAFRNAYSLQSLAAGHSPLRNIPSFVFRRSSFVRFLHQIKGSRLLLAAGLVSLVLAGAVRIPDVVLSLQSKEPVRNEERHPAEEKFVQKILQYAPQTRWMVTDMPMLPFMANLATPPDLAVVSWKRLASGDLSEVEILQQIQELRPEQVLFGRFYLPTIEEYLSENYRVIHQRETMKLYVRSDLEK